MVFIEYPSCGTCKKARKYLEERKIPFTSRHIVKETPSAEELRTFWERSGLPLRKLFNTSGQSYRNQNLKERLDQMTQEEQLSLLASDGMLIKRPILIGDHFVLFGFREKEWEDKLG